MNPGVPQVESEAMKLGLLMEAAQTQQALAAAALDRLRDHTTTLDAVVRDEIRAGLAEELRALGEETSHATDALRRMQRTANLRLALWSAAMLAASSAAPAILGWCILPSRSEIASLEEQRARLRADLTALREQGAGLVLRHCGAERRLCVRVERSGAAYGEHGDFLPVKAD